MNRTCEICHGEQHTPEDHPFLPNMETHNPMDTPFGYEVNEINKNVKQVDEGGEGSGRQPDFGDPASQGTQPGELIAFETVSIPGSASAVSIGGTPHVEPKKKFNETISKSILDNKLKCPCKNTKKNT